MNFNHEDAPQGHLITLRSIPFICTTGNASVDTKNLQHREPSVIPILILISVGIRHERNPDVQVILDLMRELLVNFPVGGTYSQLNVTSPHYSTSNA